MTGYIPELSVNAALSVIASDRRERSNLLCRRDCFVAEFILSPSTTLRTGLSKGSSQ